MDRDGDIKAATVGKVGDYGSDFRNGEDDGSDVVRIEGF